MGFVGASLPPWTYDSKDPLYAGLFSFTEAFQAYKIYRLKS